jgi:hypothetical protein
MSSTQPRKQPNNPQPLNNNEEETPVTITPKEQFKYGDVKVTSPGVGKVSIVIH